MVDQRHDPERKDDRLLAWAVPSITGAFLGLPMIVSNRQCGPHDLPSCHPAPVLKHALRLGQLTQRGHHAVLNGKIGIPRHADERAMGLSGGVAQ